MSLIELPEFSYPLDDKLVISPGIFKITCAVSLHKNCMAANFLLFQILYLGVDQYLNANRIVKFAEIGGVDIQVTGNIFMRNQS